ncbi:MAG: phosphate uptake regulator, partial [uncultured archaeon A07HR60]
MRESFQSQLDALQRDVLVMGETVAKRLEAALRGITDGDVAAAEAVIERDDEINQTYLELESDCVDLLALQQPVASDLR